MVSSSDVLKVESSDSMTQGLITVLPKKNSKTFLKKDRTCLTLIGI